MRIEPAKRRSASPKSARPSLTFFRAVSGSTRGDPSGYAAGLLTREKQARQGRKESAYSETYVGD